MVLEYDRSNLGDCILQQKTSPKQALVLITCYISDDGHKYFVRSKRKATTTTHSFLRRHSLSSCWLLVHVLWYCLRLSAYCVFMSSWRLQLACSCPHDASLTSSKAAHQAAYSTPPQHSAPAPPRRRLLPRPRSTFLGTSSVARGGGVQTRRRVVEE